MNITTPSGNLWQLWLDGAEELVKVWDSPPSQAGIPQRSKQRQALETRTYFFGETEPIARKVLLEGWPEGAKLVERLAASVQEELPPPKSRRRTRKWSQDGDEISFERLQLGQEPWLSSHRTLKSSCGLVEVVAEWGLSCGARLEQLQYQGAAALALTDLLEKADYSVELALVTALAAHDGTSMVRVDLKKMGELANLEQLAAIAVYPPAYRLYGLAAFQLGPFSSGDGYSRHPHAQAFRFESNGMWDYRSNVMTVKLSHCNSEQDAKENVIEAITQLESLVNPQDAEEI